MFTITITDVLMLLSKIVSHEIFYFVTSGSGAQNPEIPALVKRELTTDVFCCRSWDYFLLLKISCTCDNDVFLIPIYYVATDSTLLI